VIVEWTGYVDGYGYGRACLMVTGDGWSVAPIGVVTNRLLTDWLEGLTDGLRAVHGGRS
jgi:hypothetical protein